MTQQGDKSNDHREAANQLGWELNNLLTEKDKHGGYRTECDGGDKSHKPRRCLEYDRTNHRANNAHRSSSQFPFDERCLKELTADNNASSVLLHAGEGGYANRKYRANQKCNGYNPQIQISAESGTKRSIFRQKNKTKRSKKRLRTTLIKSEQKVNETSVPALYFRKNTFRMAF